MEHEPFYAARRDFFCIFLDPFAAIIYKSTFYYYKLTHYGKSY
ncbi:MAG: hypothetical protein ACD_28C00063G0015 [uncultured bacterium]|nr:MAG: hypothetical protein ACD_28C00063G0015 [uncultured bacterium]